MIYLKIEDFPQVVNERIDLNQFHIKYPNITPIPLGTMDDQNRTLAWISDFVINTHGIWQVSDYGSASSPYRKIERLVSFQEPLTQQALLEKNEHLLAHAETTFGAILSTPGEVIDPETFEPFDKNSPEFTQYCEKLKPGLEQMRLKVQDLKAQVKNAP
jgi:hypothetical protein